MDRAGIPLVMYGVTVGGVDIMEDGTLNVQVTDTRFCQDWIGEFAADQHNAIMMAPFTIGGDAPVTPPSPPSSEPSE